MQEANAETAAIAPRRLEVMLFSLFHRYFHQSVFETEVRQFIANARLFRYLIAPVNWLEVFDGQLFIVSMQIVYMMLMDYKVGDGCLQMQGCRSGQRAGTDVGLHAHIIDISHVADFLSLCKPSTIAQIGLNYLHGVVFIIFCILPSGIDPFAMGNGHL